MSKGKRGKVYDHRMTTIVDLSHFIAPGMPVYPGTRGPTLREANTIEKNGFAETSIGMYSHTGTHVDAPAHMLAGAPTLDGLTVEHFVGQACVIDVSAVSAPTIEVATLDACRDLVAGCAFVLFHTGWSRYWGQARYFAGFPVLSAGAARWLVQRGLHGVGFDAISVDPVDATEFVNHLEFFRAGMVIVENLAGLDVLVGQRVLFSCLPLKFANADGSPVRAVATIERPAA
jgi:kynurenine formamidase